MIQSMTIIVIVSFFPKHFFFKLLIVSCDIDKFKFSAVSYASTVSSSMNDLSVSEKGQEIQMV